MDQNIEPLYYNIVVRGPIAAVSSADPFYIVVLSPYIILVAG